MYRRGGAQRVSPGLRLFLVVSLPLVILLLQLPLQIRKSGNLIKNFGRSKYMYVHCAIPFLHQLPEILHNPICAYGPTLGLSFDLRRNLSVVELILSIFVLAKECNNSARETNPLLRVASRVRECIILCR